MDYTKWLMTGEVKKAEGTNIIPDPDTREVVFLEGKGIVRLENNIKRKHDN